MTMIIDYRLSISNLYKTNPNNTTRMLLIQDTNNYYYARTTADCYYYYYYFSFKIIKSIHRQLFITNHYNGPSVQLFFLKCNKYTHIYPNMLYHWSSRKPTKI